MKVACVKPRRTNMKTQSPRTIVHSILAMPLLFLSTVSAVAITDLGLSPGPDVQTVGIDNHGQRPRFISNTLLVKLTPQARASLKVMGEDIHPHDTGLPSLDAICREHGVVSFRSIVTAGAHRDPAAAIHSWYKLTLAGPEARLTLLEPSNDEASNLALS